MTDQLWLRQTLADGIPARPPSDVIAWAEEHVRLPGSARSERFSSSITPWTREPIQRAVDGQTRMVTFIKPVQAGGSVVGEVVLCYWLAFPSGGDVQYNWEDDEKSRERWDKRIERILLACRPVKDRWPVDRFKAQKGLVLFPSCNLTVQGAWVPENLDSDSIRYQINEELHNWKPGHLQKALNRTTAFWNSVVLNISNAGKEGDQLYQAWQDGTQQTWEVQCPGCRGWHQMRTRWEDDKPTLGGLRYDADGCRREDGTYDYNRLAVTVRYQMPCGFVVRDTVTERRALSQSGRYSEPANTGAHLSNRSYRLEAVAVDYIPWLRLIQEKHRALFALKRGDPEPWGRYLRERECGWLSPSSRPLVGRVVLSKRRKDRAGLDGRHARFAALDRQQGELARGEVPHWWLVIRDVMPNGDSLLVFEGKLLTDEDTAATIARHEVIPRCVVADSGDDTTHVYQFCLQHGYNSIKGAGEAWFSHADGGRRIFSPERPLHLMLGAPPTRENPIDEPQFWLYSKAGIRDRLAWLRGGALRWEVPSDVSDDYKAHMESEEIEDQRNARTGEIQHVWVQHSPRNDLFVCECYIAMLMDMAGLIGAPEIAE